MTGLQRLVLFQEVTLDVTYAQTCAACLVAVCGANALARSTNLVLAFGCLVCTIQNAVRGQDEVCAAADVQTVLQVIAGTLQFLCFCHEQVRCNNASVTDDVQLSFVKNTGWYRTEDKFLSFKDNRVTCVGTTCETCNHVVLRCEHINDLTFAFIAKYYA